MKFPAIDKKSFSVLYNNKVSRLNPLVSVIVDTLIIKELFDYLGDEIVENLMLNFQLHYTSHTTNLKEQPLGNNS